MDLSAITMYQACLLHSRAERVLKTMVSRCLEDWEITRMEWILLATVAEQSKVPAGHTMGELADVLDVRMSQVTALMTKMTEAQLLRQETSATDRRTRYVTITKRGTKLLDEIEKSMRGAMRDWLGSIPRADLSVYMRTVERLGNS